HAIFSSPQVAGVGFTEQELIKEQEKNKTNNNSESIIKYQKSVYPYMDTAMGQVLEDRDGFVKFLVNKKDRKILGCHIIGSQASILIHEVLIAMRSNEGFDTIDTCTSSSYSSSTLRSSCKSSL